MVRLKLILSLNLQICNDTKSTRKLFQVLYTIIAHSPSRNIIFVRGH